MFFGIDLRTFLLFPVQDAESRRRFLVGCLVSLFAMIVPILPYFFLMGYAARIARQVFRNEPPRMPAWDDWQSLFVDGGRMFGARFIYSLPILILTLPLMISFFILPFVMIYLDETADNATVSSIFLLYFLAIMGFLTILAPISIVVSVIIPAAEMHTVSKGEFAAALRVREWWGIFRSNIGGFAAAFAVYILAAMAASFLFQIVMLSLILICLMPILLPVITMYLVLIMYTTIAQAYRDGEARFSTRENAPNPIPA
ncbi:MAG: DUF4013 domain-containing protein [Chloroflexi bacterium]|nr:DUF4013 domain-containing protein [Chloroflexota bacterium]